MRTNIEIDDELMAKALRLSGLRTKRAAVEAGLRALIEKRGRELLLEAGGRYPWEGRSRPHARTPAAGTRVIAVDSSVRIGHLRDRETRQVQVLRSLLRGERVGPILVGDIVIYEVLAGLRSAAAARQIRELLETLLLVPMVDFDLVPQAVAHFHALRGRHHAGHGRHVRWHLLHRDRRGAADRRPCFLPMRDHLGLRLVN